MRVSACAIYLLSVNEFLLFYTQRPVRLATYALTARQLRHVFHIIPDGAGHPASALFRREGSTDLHNFSPRGHRLRLSGIRHWLKITMKLWLLLFTGPYSLICETGMRQPRRLDLLRDHELFLWRCVDELELRRSWWDTSGLGYSVGSTTLTSMVPAHSRAKLNSHCA